MDLNGIITGLKAERDALSVAIACLESVAGGGKRRGRPPAWLSKGIELVGQRSINASKHGSVSDTESHPDQAHSIISAA